MMNLVNLLVQDIAKFAAERDLDLCFMVKLIDYRLASIGINIEDTTEVETYINNVRILNNLFLLLGLATDFTDTQRKAYNNDLLMGMLDDPSRLVKYKDFKLATIKKQFKADVELFEEYIAQES